MKAQQDNLIVSSFLLMIDHEIQKQGQAYTNQSGLFYPDVNEFQGIYTYTCPYKQLCNDVSISGANVMSGVYLNNTYVNVGQSGLLYINHYDGSVNFSSPIPPNVSISGNFAVKDFNVYLSDQPDFKVLMEGKFSSNPKYVQQITGAAQDAMYMPAVILVPRDAEARPLAFAGLDDNFMRIRAMVVSQTLFQRVAVSNILKNFRLKTLPIFNNLPLDYLGNMTGTNYNYTGLTFNTQFFPYIMAAKVTQIPEGQTYSDATKQFAMVDFDISTWGGHL